MCSELAKGGTTQQFQVLTGRSLHGLQRVQHQIDVGSVEKASILLF